MYYLNLNGKNIKSAKRENTLFKYFLKYDNYNNLVYILNDEINDCLLINQVDSKFYTYLFNDMETADKFQTACKEGGLITKRDNNLFVSVYINSEYKPLHFSNKYYIETILNK